MNVICHLEMPENDGTAANRAVPAYPCASGYPDTASKGAVSAYVHVVSNLDLVVQLDAILDDSIVKRTPVYSCVCADLDIITNQNPTGLRNLQPLAIFHGHAETVCAYDGASMNNDTFPQNAVMVDADIGAKPCVAVDPGLVPYEATWSDHRVVANDCPLSHMDMCGNLSPGGHNRI